MTEYIVWSRIPVKASSRKEVQDIMWAKHGIHEFEILGIEKAEKR